MSLEATSISDIKSNILRPATTSQFYASVPFPQESLIASRLQKLLGPDQRKLTLACSEVSLPGSSFATTKIDNDRTGVTETHAYRRLYDNQADFSFYVDREYRIVDFFENWIAYISGEDSVDNQGDPDYNYRVNFPEDYKTSQLYIKKFERDYSGNELIYQFINAFPVSINSMPVSYETSQVMKFTVSFSYSRYVIDRKNGR